MEAVQAVGVGIEVSTKEDWDIREGQSCSGKAVKPGLKGNLVKLGGSCWGYVADTKQEWLSAAI